MCGHSHDDVCVCGGGGVRKSFENTLPLLVCRVSLHISSVCCMCVLWVWA